MTEHEQLLELEPLMNELGWWPEEIYLVDSGKACILVERETFDQLEEIPDNFALHIVTGVAEKEMGKKGYDWYPMTWGVYRNYRDHPVQNYSLADVLWVEIERSKALNNKGK